jgi:large subunit ribosomal protein L9
LEEPIKALGIYSVPVKLHKDVVANIKVWVVKE